MQRLNVKANGANEVVIQVQIFSAKKLKSHHKQGQLGFASLMNISAHQLGALSWRPS
jgi:hypothetical protein